ncbi:MAG: glycoside hydrolase [Alphaproteobacteria bacterium]|nr:glycoside hydrolase [Alphaproteobacteria bacterium]
MAKISISPSKRGAQAVVGALAFAAASGWTYWQQPAPLPDQPKPIVQMVRPAVVAPALTPEKLIHQQIAAGKIPPAVRLAVDHLIIPWEGLVLKSHWDKFSKRYDICYGDTLIDGKPVKPGMVVTKAYCDALLIKRVIHDYYLPLVDGVKGYAVAPDSVQASMLSGAYNFGAGRQIKSKTAGFVGKGQYADACRAQLVFIKSGGHEVEGLKKRRGMGDKQRKGEGEVCLSGLPKKDQR